MIDYRKTYDAFLDIVASNLHYQDVMEQQGDNQRLTVQDVMNRHEGFINRYRNDPLFNARVDSMVAALTVALRELEEDV